MRLVACPNHRIRKNHALKTFWAKGYLAFTATCRSRNSAIFDVSGRASPLALFSNNTLNAQGVNALGHSIILGLRSKSVDLSPVNDT